jgi:Domain of unknown function (DUF4136)
MQAEKGERMKALRTLFVTAATIAALSCIGWAQDVHTDHDKKANFERYHTYFWAKVQTTNPLWQQRIQDAVDHELQAKGWQRNDSNGDVALMAVGSAQNQQEYRTFYDGLGGWRWGGFGTEASTTVENYRVGTLVLDMYDAANKQLIWRGTASETLSDKPERNEKKLEKSVEKMFKDFPPKSKG